ncbi:hypothetical protein [Flavobacterium noncentrifugens]|uniref:Lipoprotein n=1 Tax=Flavobacterium noncentrifugens TaxID=1128970 RepID=A0A1G9AR93_9FLAO|nr:hypothetical protein [Flavobacterium noncentrifugens]SDK29892.1 hypothetical protein SAMN04487935_3021 [Flavobacterium noncentrifugens]
MKKLFFLILVAIFMTSCKEDAVENQVDEIAAQTSATAQSGRGKIQLSCGKQSLSIEGECGGITTMGELIIAVKDKIVPSRVFMISFNTDQFPEDGKTYTIKKSDYTTEGKKPATDIYVGFSEVSPNNQMDWSSDKAS